MFLHVRLQVLIIGAGDYSTWFAEQPTPLLLNALTFVVTGLHDLVLCLPAAGALRQLCDANRTKLAPHIASFGDILTSSAKIPVRFPQVWQAGLCLTIYP